MLSLKDYAQSAGVSYEAVRQQVNRYKMELSGHIQKEGRTQFLDDEAIAFLDRKRQENPVVKMAAEIKELETVLQAKDEQIKLLREKIALLESELESERMPKKRNWFKWFWRRREE